MLVDKEKILEARLGNYAGRFGGSTTIDLFCAMDEFAKQQSIAFKNWINNESDKRVDILKQTDEQLYNLFIEHNNKG